MKVGYAVIGWEIHPNAPGITPSGALLCKAARFILSPDGPGFLFALMPKRHSNKTLIKRKVRYRTFCAEYVKDLNGTRSAIAAGYSKRTAYSKANQLLKKDEVKAILARLMAKKADKLEISADKVLGELAKMGFSNMLDYMRADEDPEFRLDFSKLTREQAAAIQEYTVDATGGTGDGERKQVMRTRFKLADKARSLELLGKYLKLFADRVEVTGLENLAETLAAARARMGK